MDMLCACVSAKSLSRVWLCATPWTVACQASLSMQECWKKWKRTLLQNTGEVVISCSRGSSQPMDETCVSCIFWVGRWIPYRCATWEARCYFIVLIFTKNIYKGISTTDLYMRLQLILFYLMTILTAEIEQQWKWSLHEVLSFLTWIGLVKISNYF